MMLSALVRVTGLKPDANSRAAAKDGPRPRCAKVGKPAGSEAGTVSTGTWPSLVGHLTGGQGVAGSNPAVPTIFRTAWGPAGNQVVTIMSVPRRGTGNPPPDVRPMVAPGRGRMARPWLPLRHSPRRPEPVKGAYGVPTGRPLTEPDRESRSSQLWGAWAALGRSGSGRDPRPGWSPRWSHARPPCPTCGMTRPSHIVPIYQLDASGRRFAIARLTRELR